MDKIFITAIICATITALAWMAYDLRRRRIIAADKRAKTRTIEKEVVVEVPVYQTHGAPPEPAEKHRRGKGSIKGYYVGQDGSVQTVTEGSGRNGTGK